MLTVTLNTPDWYSELKYDVMYSPVAALHAASLSSSKLPIPPMVMTMFFVVAGVSVSPSRVGDAEGNPVGSELEVGTAEGREEGSATKTEGALDG